MKKWLTERFLPMWAKQTVLSDNRRLERENAALRQSLLTKDAYIRGIREGVRSAKRMGRQGGKE